MRDCLMSGLAMMLFKDLFLCDFRRRISKVCLGNNLQSMFAVSDIPEDSQVREFLDVVDPADREPVFSSLLGQLLRVKYLA